MQRTAPYRPRPEHVFGGLALLLAWSAFRGLRKSLTERGNDLTIYLDAGDAVLSGLSPMGVEGYLYLPCFAVLMAPLAWLPTWLGAFLWQAASWAALLYSAKTAARLVGTPVPNPWFAPLGLLLVYRLADSNLAYGQTNAFTLAAILKTLDYGLRGKDQKAAGLIGFAAAVKILPGILIVLFALRRRFQVAVTGTLVFATIAMGLPLVVLGLETGSEANRTWYTQVLQPYQIGGTALLDSYPYLMGQSLVAKTYHYLADTQVSATHVDLRVNLFDLAPATVHWIVRTLTAVHLLVFVGLAWKAPRFREHSANLVSLAALALCTALLVTPIAHRAHMLWTMLAIMQFLCWSQDREGFGRRGIMFTLALFGGLIGLTSSGILGKENARWLMTHGVVFFAVEALWVALVWRVWSQITRPIPGGFRTTT